MSRVVQEYFLHNSAQSQKVLGQEGVVCLSAVRWVGLCDLLQSRLPELQPGPVRWTLICPLVEALHPSQQLCPSAEASPRSWPCAP